MAVMGRFPPHSDSLPSLGALKLRPPEFCMRDGDFFPGGTPYGEPRRQSVVHSLAGHLGSLSREFKEALRVLEQHDGSCPYYARFLLGEPCDWATFGTCLGPSHCFQSAAVMPVFPRLVTVPRTSSFGSQLMCAAFADTLATLVSDKTKIHYTLVTMSFLCDLAVEFLRQLDP